MIDYDNIAYITVQLSGAGTTWKDLSWLHYATPEVSRGSLHVSPVACLWYSREGRPYFEGEGEIVRDE